MGEEGIGIFPFLSNSDQLHYSSALDFSPNVF
jgi:hypothetical protein